jgi:hypothetical protein
MELNNVAVCCTVSIASILTTPKNQFNLLHLMLVIAIIAPWIIDAHGTKVEPTFLRQPAQKKK